MCVCVCVCVCVFFRVKNGFFWDVAIVVSFGSLLGCSWPLLGRSWGGLGRSWGVFGGGLGRYLAIEGRK